MKIGCSGPVGERSGIGIVQKHLYAYLESQGHELSFSATRDMGESPISRARGLARGLRPASGDADAYLSTVPPLPLGITAPLLAVIHDLRWRRTRSRLGSRYRGWDLHRTVDRADSLLCISQTTRRELIEFAPRAAVCSTVQWLGSGQVPEGSFVDSASGIVMLVGAAAHKRNEEAAAALAFARPPWIRGIVGVGVGPAVRHMLSPIYPCEWLNQVDESSMVELYQRAQYFLMIGTNEGFGLPFVEALAAGCQVIAVDHPLAREIVGSAGVLLADGDARALGMQLMGPPAVPAHIRAEKAAKYSWRAFAHGCEQQLLSIAKKAGASG